MKEIYFTENAPAPIGPYSQSVSSNGKMMFISGQIPFTAEGVLVSENIAEQAEQVCKNLGAILNNAGLDYTNVVKTTIFLKTMNDFAVINEIYGKYFGESKPARSTVEVSRLPKDVLVEIEAIAFF